MADADALLLGRRASLQPSSIAQKFGAVAILEKNQSKAAKNAASPKVSPKKIKVAGTLEASNLFAVQKSVIAAEESHLQTCEAKGLATNTVHPSQKDADEGSDDKLPAWRAQQVRIQERDSNNTYDLPDRQAARVKARAKEKKARELAAKQAIAAGLPGMPNSELEPDPETQPARRPDPPTHYPDDGF